MRGCQNRIRANRRTARSGQFGVGFPAEKIMLKFRVVWLAVLLLMWASRGSAQFAHVEHKQIVDAAGKPVLLRATNLGNWMVPEGYMWLFQGGPQSPSEIRALVLELLGPEASAAFWQKYRENYITREDIALLHRAGFNAIRVPLHYSLFESGDAEGFQLLDRLIGWSRAENLYVILDLHAAPGGQTGTNIDDSAGYPWLYQSPQEQEHLMAIWRRLATHYRDEPAVLGYDLLNEPIPPFPKLANLNSALEPLYKKVAGEIRKMDAHHILFLGGAQWDGNFSVFGKPFDANGVYTFHKYWTAPDESVMRQYIDFRERYDVPIWLGESGENPDEWIAQFVKALEKNNIGWAFWPYKKMGKPSAVVSIIPPDDWGKIVDFAKLPRGTGHAEERLKARPEQETIARAFAELLERVRVQKCRVNEGYLRALGLKADIAAVGAGEAAK
jgi:aryl-phospho-beta-D-glucosidase BglC (GH1 family)